MSITPSAKPSSYLPMENLETQKNVINLGKRLLDNFQSNSEDEVDEITAWMIHYLAEQITLAEETDDESAKQKCFETILKLWEKQHHFQNGMRPFENFEPILETLESLHPDSPKLRYLLNNIMQGKPSSISTECESWLDVAKSLDKTARILISFCISCAVEDATDDNVKHWLNKFSEFTPDPIISLSAFYNDEKDSKNAENQKELDLLNTRLEQLDLFEQSCKNIRKKIENDILNLKLELPQDK